MPLLDHFHPPLLGQRPWESFHAIWAAEIAAGLNEGGLPDGYFAIVQTHIGSRIEVDVATMHQNGSPTSESGSASEGGIAVRTWAPPTPRTIEVTYPDQIEALVYREGFPTLVAAIELVSPSNKDRPEARQMFVGKCLNYLFTGVGVLIVDVVTSRRSNLHGEMVGLLGRPAQDDPVNGADLYAVSYRPGRADLRTGRLDYWPETLSLGGELPTMPLALYEGPTIPIALEARYTEACRRSAIRTDG